MDKKTSTPKTLFGTECTTADQKFKVSLHQPNPLNLNKSKAAEIAITGDWIALCCVKFEPVLPEKPGMKGEMGGFGVPVFLTTGRTGLGRRVVSWLHWGCLGSFLFLNSVPPDDASSLLFGFFRHSHVEDAGRYA
jgi:hypothetical protein